MNWTDITFADPYILWGLILVPLLLLFYIWNQRRQQAPLRYSSLRGIGNTSSWRVKLYPLLIAFRLLALGLLVVALARPQTSSRKQDISVKGIDIMITLDVSTSMLATDFHPNRLEAAKNVASEFIEGRKNDRIGMAIFSGEPFVQCPLTTDHPMIQNLIKDISAGRLKDGTAIGDGLATSVQRLKSSKAISRVIILLTDGVNNRGSIDPQTAAEMAEIYGIRVYTIGVGSDGKARMPVAIDRSGKYVFRQRKVNIDEKALKKIASTTNGKYFRATNKEKMKEIYKSIDKLEKSKIDVKRYERKHEEFFIFALIAAIIILAEIILRKTVFQTIP